MAMAKQDLQRAFDDLRDNNDKGYRAYRVAEFLAPMVGDLAPVDDTDLALFEGQEYVVTSGVDVGKKYFAISVTDTTTTWKQYATV